MTYHFSVEIYLVDILNKSFFDCSNNFLERKRKMYFRIKLKFSIIFSKTFFLFLTKLLYYYYYYRLVLKISQGVTNL